MVSSHKDYCASLFSRQQNVWLQQIYSQAPLARGEIFEKNTFKFWSARASRLWRICSGESNQWEKKKEIKWKKRYSYGDFMHFRLIFEPSYWKQPLTVSKKKIGWSKFGFLCVFLIMDDWMVLPPHSNSILGDETFANWNFFMFLTPQQRT